MNNLLLSFVIPAYKVEPYIAECLNSLVVQKGEDLEFIVVDDGSPDNSGNIADEFALRDRRVKVVHKKNEGVSVARNIGIQAAKGEWICFVDADDKVVPGFVEKLRDKLLEEFDIIVFAHKNLNGANIPEVEQDGKIEVFRPKEIRQIARKMVFLVPGEKRDFFYDFGYAWGKIYRKSLITRAAAKFPRGIKIWEDKTFNLQLLCYANKMVGIHEKLYIYRKNRNSAIYQKRPDIASICANVCKINWQIILNQYGDAEMLERYNAFCISALYVSIKNMATYREMLLNLRSVRNEQWYVSALHCRDVYLEKKKKLVKYLLLLRFYRILYLLMQKKIS